MSEIDVELAVSATIIAKNRPPEKGSFFKAVGNSVLTGHASIPDVMTYELEDDTSITEFRSKEDKRGRLDVTNQARFYDWLFENAGSDTLPGIFRKDGDLIRVPSIGEAGWIEPGAGEDDGPAQVRALSPTALGDVIQHRFWPYIEKVDLEKDKKTGEIEKKRIIRTQALIPREVMNLAVAGAPEWERIPAVTSVSHTPTLRKDGTFIKEPGYDSLSGVLYLPDHGLRPLEMPEVGSLQPSAVVWARGVINDLLQDFPFERPGHKANYVSLLLTPILRRVLPPPYPMFAINAHQRGTGKSLLAKMARTIHGGIHRPELPEHDDEIRKQITSILMTTTAPLVNWDNATAQIKSGMIANLLTTNTWQDRPLGRTDNVIATNDRIWMVTGNNVKLGGDLARRVQWVIIDAETKNPEYRTGFKIPNLIDYVEKNRGAIVTALMVLAGWWVQEGMPYRQIRTDDYDLWAGSMIEILRLCEMGEGFGVRETVDEQLSEDEQELEILIEMCWHCFNSSEWQIADLKEKAMQMSYHEFIDTRLPSQVKESRDQWKSLGRYLGRHEKTFAGDKRFIKVGSARGGVKWMIEHKPSPAA